MIRNHSQSQTRSAFTLVELIVVLLIILILVSLLGSAVLKAMDKIPEVQTRTEIAELGVALDAFKADYNLTNPPPSGLILYENISLYATSPLPGASLSYQFLQQTFGKNLGPFVDWNGDLAINGPGGNATLPWILEGEYCLVFYLGGIPNTAAMLTGSPPAPQGFSTNNMAPSTVGGKRKGPYFTFDTTRLKPNPANGYFMFYVDPWQSKKNLAMYTTWGGTPYAYFSSRGINNGYNSVPPGDCGSIGASQYYIAAGQYTYPNTYQIISAGKNGVFGNGFWSPSSGPIIPSTLLPDPAGADDQANFSGGLLGTGQQ